MHVRHATQRRPFQEGLEGLAGAVTPAGDRSDPTGAPRPSSPCTSICERVPALSGCTWPAFQKLPSRRQVSEVTPGLPSNCGGHWELDRPPHPPAGLPMAPGCCPEGVHWRWISGVWKSCPVCAWCIQAVQTTERDAPRPSLCSLLPGILQRDLGVCPHMDGGTEIGVRTQLLVLASPCVVSLARRLCLAGSRAPRRLF